MAYERDNVRVKRLVTAMTLGNVMMYHITTRHHFLSHLHFSHLITSYNILHLLLRSSSLCFPPFLLTVLPSIPPHCTSLHSSSLYFPRFLLTVLPSIPPHCTSLHSSSLYFPPFLLTLFHFTYVILFTSFYFHLIYSIRTNMMKRMRLKEAARPWIQTITEETYTPSMERDY